MRGQAAAKVAVIDPFGVGLCFPRASSKLQKISALAYKPDSANALLESASCRESTNFEAPEYVSCSPNAVKLMRC